MNAIRRSVFFLWLLALIAMTAQGQIYQGRQLVEADALANVSAIVPGEPFLVGVRLKMQPHWHTYWKYPGDAGIPTDIKWELPEGWRVGNIQWPIPLKLEEPGDILIYGYHDEVLLIQQITPAKNVTNSTVKLSAKVNWLVCEKICIPGDAIVTLSLPSAATNSPANTDLFARFQKRLPGSPAANFSASWKSDAAGLVLNVSQPELAKFPSVEFFPSPQENVAVGHPRLESHEGANYAFRIPLDNAKPNFKSLPGLIVFGSATDAPDRRAWDISVGAEMAAANENSPSSGVVRFLIFGFIGGFILNLMPCVLPVISLKIFGFVQQAGQSRARIFRSGLAFIAGIFAWFLGLALVLVIIKSAGGQPVWAAQFTNPYFVLFMSAVVLVFALNLFGVFEINLPQWLSRRAVAAEGSMHGDAGSFFQGVFATVLATPCTAPFLGTALGFAFTQSATVILLMFGSIALGMSAPYFLLSAQPAWLKFLPKPGPWMVRVKQLMGFLLIATLLFLLSVLGAQRGVAALIWTCSFLLVLSVACWMKGAFLTPLVSAKTRGLVLVLMLLLVIGSGIYFIGDKFQSAAAAANPTASSGAWEKFTPERLASELQQGHSVFIDFTAEWCITCKFNESTVLETAAVRTAFSERQIVKLKADWTNGDPAITKLLKQFGRPGVPLYVLYPGGTAQPYVFPELLTKNIVLEKLETVNQTIASQ
ncbi:MAG: thiol:disulfide interchange protein [Verrucomicrobia bacterium]|nr:MAG: thiol:disulfide interchange protein [Verrucomicrobiota bacterium]